MRIFILLLMVLLTSCGESTDSIKGTIVDKYVYSQPKNVFVTSSEALANPGEYEPIGSMYLKIDYTLYNVSDEDFTTYNAGDAVIVSRSLSLPFPFNSLSYSEGEAVSYVELDGQRIKRISPIRFLNVPIRLNKDI